MTFTIYPAIDLRGGKCVRLSQGDYAQETVYGEDPLNMCSSMATNRERSGSISWTWMRHGQGKW